MRLKNYIKKFVSLVFAAGFAASLSPMSAGATEIFVRYVRPASGTPYFCVRLKTDETTSDEHMWFLEVAKRLIMRDGRAGRPANWDYADFTLSPLYRQVNVDMASRGDDSASLIITQTKGCPLELELGLRCAQTDGHATYTLYLFESVVDDVQVTYVDGAPVIKDLTAPMWMPHKAVASFELDTSKSMQGQTPPGEREPIPKPIPCCPRNWARAEKRR